MGATLLAKGLLLSNRQIWWLADTLKGQQIGIRDRGRNKALAWFGLLSLGIGFGLQAAGYLLEIRGDAIATGGSRFARGLITVAVAGVIATLPWLGSWRMGHPEDRKVSPGQWRLSRQKTTQALTGSGIAAFYRT